MSHVSDVPVSQSLSRAGHRARLTPPIAIVLVAVMFFPLQQWADYDIFWHLSNGRLLAEDGLFPSPDRFSWSAAGGHVALNSVQVDHLFYLIWQWAGPAALASFSALLYGAALLPFALYIGRVGFQPWAEVVALIFLAVALLPYSGARPHLLGTVILGLLVLLVERPFGLWKALAAGAALGLWVNLHGSFFVGFVLMGSAAFAWLMLRDRRATACATLSLAIGASATALSPYGLELWRMPFRVSSHPLLSTVNTDWFSLRPFSPSYAPMGLLILAAAALGTWRRWEPRTLAALILILPAIQYARLTPFAAPLLFVVVIDRLVERAPWIAITSTSSIARHAARRSMEGIAWGIVILGTILLSIKAPSQIESSAIYPFPEVAVDRLLECGAPGPVWNDYNWGGYLLWRGNGEYTVAIDGRAEALYAVDVFTDYLTVVQGQIGWDRIIQQSPAQYALIPADSLFSIGSLPGWQVVHTDAVAILAARTNAVWLCE